MCTKFVNFFSLRPISRSSLVPRIFRSTAYLRGSSKRTLAAAWYIIETLFNRFMSSALKPKPNSQTSPKTAETLLITLGFSLFTLSKRGLLKMIRRRSSTDLFFFGRTKMYTRLRRSQERSNFSRRALPTKPFKRALNQNLYPLVVSQYAYL